MAREGHLLAVFSSFFFVMGGTAAVLVGEYFSDSFCQHSVSLMDSNVADVCFPSYNDKHYTSGECSVFEDGPLLTSELEIYGESENMDYNNKCRHCFLYLYKFAVDSTHNLDHI